MVCTGRAEARLRSWRRGKRPPPPSVLAPCVLRQPGGLCLEPGGHQLCLEFSISPVPQCHIKINIMAPDYLSVVADVSWQTWRHFPALNLLYYLEKNNLAKK